MSLGGEEKFRVLSQVVAATFAHLPLEHRLKEAARAVAAGLGVDLCAVLLLEEGRQGLRVAAVNDDSLLRGPEAHLRLAAELTGGGGQGVPWPPELTQDWLAASLLADHAAVLSWPLRDEDFLYGLLCVGRRFGAEGLPADLLDAVARELASAVRHSRHYRQAKREVAELNVLSEVSRWIGSTMELDELLRLVVTIVPRIAHARGCAVGLADVRSLEARVARLREGEVLALCRSADGRESLRAALDEELGTPEMCVPLTFKSDIEGRLCLYGLERSVEPPAELMVGVAGVISSTLENAIIFRQIGELAERNQRMVRLLSTFYEFSQAVMASPRSEDRLRVIVRALTLPQGLRFGRAMLLLVDDEAGLLRCHGALAASPEAGLATARVSLAESLTCNGCLPEDTFKEAQGFEMSLNPGTDILADTVRKGTARLVVEPAQETLVHSAFLSRFGGVPFAAVPIKAKDRVIGLLYVDNGPSGLAVAERDLKALSMLANLAGLALDSALLYEHLESVNQELTHARERLMETEKLAALGELAAGMAHEIRNPLVSIGGFTRRVDRTVDETSPVKPYLAVIINEVEKLERTLGEILTFSGEGGDHFAPHDLNRIVEEALGLLKREFDETSINIKREYGELPMVLCDSRQVKHVFFNILLNARQAMGEEGSLTVRTGLERGKRPKVWCEISDTGSGIAPQLLHNIFNPFFTTKDTGSGLGLSIAHKIMTRHGGEITVANKSGAGAAFTVKLPLVPEESLKEESR
jgi:two-component system sensor histidine kinase HydH